jgi:ribosomal protein L20A (L18A)
LEDLHKAAEIVKEFHSHHSNEDFINAQKTCRSLWEEHMTENGFYKDFASKMSLLI